MSYVLSEEPWFTQGLRFSCQPGCMRCCGGAPGDVFVNEEEIDAMAALLNLTAAQFEEKYVRHYFSSGRMSLKELRNGDCVMLNGSGCGVYSARPKQCRDYPFWPEVMRSVFSWIREADRCPGINVGEVHDAPKLVELLKSQR